MKLYVVTEGCYSDYGIVCIFLDKDKAENYVKYHQDGWDEMRIEEYETSDEEYKVIGEGYYKTEGWINITSKGTLEESYIPNVTLVDEAGENTEELYDIRENGTSMELYIIRYYPESMGDIDTVTPRERMQHVLKDLASQIADFYNKGYSFYEIKEMVGIK